MSDSPASTGVTRSETHKMIAISKNNAERQPVDEVNNEFRLIRAAIDKGLGGDWFRAGTTKVMIKAPCHDFTQGVSGRQPDFPHLTLQMNPGHAGAHLYLLPRNRTQVTADTELDWLDYYNPAPSRDVELKFWQEDPTCAEAIVDHVAASTAKSETTSAKSKIMQAVFVRSDRMWANGTTLTFSFMNEATTTAQINQQTKVKTVITEWEKYANIKFQYVDDSASATIRIAFDSSAGSWSYVGKEVSSIKPDQPTMNLGWVYGDSSSISDDERGVILHEFGHTLGLMHEHQSPLRGDKITLKEDAVVEYYTETQGWDKATVEDQIIRVYNSSAVSNYSEFDTTSIMMYFMPAAMNEQNIKVPPNNALSASDKAFMTINYPSADRAQFLAALDVAGVDITTKSNLVKSYDAQNWGEIRFEFTQFCTETRVARQAAIQPPATTPSETAHDVVPIPPLIDGCGADLENDSSDTSASRAVATSHDSLWLPGQEITYSFVQPREANEYRQSRVAETLAAYGTRVNLTFKKIPFDPRNPTADVNIFFGPIPRANTQGWSEIGTECKTHVRTNDELTELGGTAETTLGFGPVVGTSAPVDDETRVREQRTLFHEIGHTLGLRHEHSSPYTKTTDDAAAPTKWSVATLFDMHSIMLYGDRKLRASNIWDKIADFLDPRSTWYNNLPSKLDLAFLGAIYPRSSGHVKDRFEQDIRDLSLNPAQFLPLRDDAFANFDLPTFPEKIKTLRDELNKALKPIAQAAASRALDPTPAHDAGPGIRKPATAGALSKPTTGPFLDELMARLSAFFKPTSGQLFALQFPGRFLQQDLYAWDTNTAGIYGQFVKPTVVNESEFRLVDQLYNVGTVIGAPNGINLSIVYEQALNNLLPGIQDSQINFSKQQGQIRQWLLKDVPTTGWVKDLIASQHTVAPPASSGTPDTSGAAHGVNPNSSASSASSSMPSDINAKPQFAVQNKLSDDNKVNRMELSEALMEEYLAAKQAWELERDDMIKNTKQEDLDALTRRLAHITAIREAQMSAKYADAVVRGYSHVIRQYLGYMDIKTPAEALQDAKDSLRSAAVSSLDGAMKVYPVQMQPIDWFQSLSTSFTMEDLTADPALIMQQIDSKSKQIDTLNTRLAILQSKPTVNIADLQAKLDKAQDAYDHAQAALSTTYTSNVISLAKTCINAAGDFVMEDFLLQTDKLKIADAAFTNIETGMKTLTDAQLSVTQSSRAVAQLMAQKSLAEATDTTQEIIQTNTTITALTKDIDELTSRLQALRYKDGALTAVVTDTPNPPALVSIGSIPDLPPDSSSGGSRWQEFLINHTVDNKYSASTDQSSASTSKTDVSLFFGSYHNESSKSSGKSDNSNSSSSVTVNIGFRATLVTVDRGGWFQPQFFKQSAGFHSIDPSISWSKWPDTIKSIHDLTGIGGMSETEATEVCEQLNQYLLPAFPTGFVICKDITIKIASTSTDITSSSKEMEDFAATSSGILCWSTSSSSTSKQSDKSYGFQACSDGCVIRIPGPQILGYILQFTDPDTTTVVPDKLPDGFLISDAEYDSSFSNPTPSSGVNPAKAGDPNAQANNAPGPESKV